MTRDIGAIQVELHQNALEDNIRFNMLTTRKEPGLSLERVAKAIKSVLEEEEVTALINALNAKEGN